MKTRACLGKGLEVLLQDNTLGEYNTIVCAYTLYRDLEQNSIALTCRIITCLLNYNVLLTRKTTAVQIWEYSNATGRSNNLCSDQTLTKSTLRKLIHVPVYPFIILYHNL